MGFSSTLRFLWGSARVCDFSVGFSSGLRFLRGVQLGFEVSPWGSGRV